MTLLINFLIALYVNMTIMFANKLLQPTEKAGALFFSSECTDILAFSSYFRAFSVG